METYGDIQLRISPCSSNASSPISTPGMVQTPLLLEEFLDFEPESFSRSFSGIFDLYIDGRSEDVGDGHVYALERKSEGKRASCPPEERSSRRRTQGEDIYRLNLSYDVESYPNLRDIDPQWEHEEIKEIMVISSRGRHPKPTSPRDSSLAESQRSSWNPTPPDSIFSVTLDADHYNDDEEPETEEAGITGGEPPYDIDASTAFHNDSLDEDSDEDQPPIHYARRLSLTRTVASIVCTPKKRNAAVFTHSPTASATIPTVPIFPCASPFSASPPPALSTLNPSVPSTSELEREEPDSFHAAALSDFTTPRIFGEGGAARVLLAQHTPSGRVVALKRTQRAHDGAASHAAAEVAALEAISQLSVPFVSRMLCMFKDDMHTYLVLEFCSGGDLLAQLGRIGTFTADRARFYASELALALSSLHKAGIIHRDIKPENILLDRKGHIVLTDFGCAKQLVATEGHEYRARSFSNCGTLQYQPPEMILGWAHDSGVDVWGFGMLLHLMLVGKHPFLTEAEADDVSALHRKVVSSGRQHGSLSEVPDDPHAASLISQCLEPNPAHRITIAQVLKHRYFVTIDWQKVASKQYEVPWTPEFDEEEDLRYFEIPSADDSTSRYDRSKDSMEATSKILGPLKATMFDGAQMLHSPSAVACTNFAQALEHIATRRSNNISSLLTGSPTAGILRNESEDHNPFAPCTPSSADQSSCRSVSPPHFLSPGPRGLGIFGAESTPCRPNRDRAGIRASAMLRSAGTGLGTPSLKHKRSVIFECPSTPSTPNTARSTEQLDRMIHSPPMLRHKRSLLDPLALATSSVRRSLSRHFGRPALTSVTATRASTPPPLPPLPPGIERIGAGLGYTPKRAPRAPRFQPSLSSLRARTPGRASARTCGGLLRRFVSKRWGKKAMASVRVMERSHLVEDDESFSSADLDALRRELMGERAGNPPRACPLPSGSLARDGGNDPGSTVRLVGAAR